MTRKRLEQRPDGAVVNVADVPLGGCYKQVTRNNVWWKKYGRPAAIKRLIEYFRSEDDQ